MAPDTVGPASPGDPAPQPFEGLLGSSAELDVAQHFIATRGLTYTQTEVAASTGLSRQTVAKVLAKFLKWGLVRSNRRGRQVFYYLDETDSLAFALDTLNGALVEHMTGLPVLQRLASEDEVLEWRAQENEAAWRAKGKSAPDWKEKRDMAATP